MFISRRRRKQVSGLFLPAVGPFAINGNVNALSQPNIHPISSNFTTTRTSPLTANWAQFEGFNGPAFAQPLCFFIWANKISFPFGSGLVAAGQNGFGGIADDGSGNPVGGDGGSGASGGGGGGASVSTSCAIGYGGNGGSFTLGIDGVGNASGATGGFGGSAYIGAPYNAGFTYGNGSNGQNDPGGFSTGGLGGNGFGGGGAGGTSVPSCANSGSGGAGGGGGLVCAVANEFLGVNGFVDVSGGLGGPSDFGIDGVAGGPGVFYGAFRKYDGLFSGGTANVYIYEIKRDNTLVLRTISDSWNNL